MVEIKGVSVRYEWAMCHSCTFTIVPVSQLLDTEMGANELWIDPFARNSKRGGVTNDMDYACDTDHHMDALAFLKWYPDGCIDGVIYDPPYNIIQAKRLYHNNLAGMSAATNYKAHCKDEMARIVKPGGKVISFGWNSTGLGMKRGFFKEKVLLINHGGGTEHDLIIVVERKAMT